MMKKQMGMRLSEPARDLIRALADEMGLSYAAVVELAVRELAKRQGIRAEAESRDTGLRGAENDRPAT